MPDSQRATIKPGAVRSGLSCLMVLLSAWSGVCSVGTARATAAIAATALSATAAATMDREVALPAELTRSEWHSIRAAYDASRHAVQPSVKQAGNFQARNPGQQLHGQIA